MSNNEAKRNDTRKRRNPNYLSKRKVDAVAELLLQGPVNGSHPSWITYDDGIPSKYLFSSFWSKCTSPLIAVRTGSPVNSPEERSSLAVEKWLRMECRNAKTNERLHGCEVDFGFATSKQIMKSAKKFVQEVIGESPTLLAIEGGEFTGGASTRVKRGPSAIAQKFESRAHCSSSAKPYFSLIIDQCHGWLDHFPDVVNVEEVEESVMFTVPKNSGIDRVACKEPEINMYLQRGVGLFIRKKLKRVGIDLTDQSRNQRLAAFASMDRIPTKTINRAYADLHTDDWWRSCTYGHMATMDLSSASDLISRSLVELLLPPSWYKLLNALRVKRVILPDGQVHSLEMFSSMGNGFTFELESLIFWALTRSTQYHLSRFWRDIFGEDYVRSQRGPIGVFGDDIVCLRNVAKAMTRVFPFFGFIVNEKKSFFMGPYRESCGAHWHIGRNVKPVYCRELPKTMSQLIQLTNQLVEWGVRTKCTNPSFVELCNSLIALVPRKLYGGQSFERTDALVTGWDAPNRRLFQETKPEDVPQKGGLIQWFHTKEKLPNLVVSPTEAFQETGKWVTRTNRSWYYEALSSDVRSFLSGEADLIPWRSPVM